MMPCCVDPAFHAGVCVWLLTRLWQHVSSIGAASVVHSMVDVTSNPWSSLEVAECQAGKPCAHPGWRCYSFQPLRAVASCERLLRAPWGPSTCTDSLNNPPQIQDICRAAHLDTRRGPRSTWLLEARLAERVPAEE
jgi:hypothetical protein